VLCNFRELMWNVFITLSGGSLGSWVDEERSKLRADMWTAGHMNIDILNAYCGPYWLVSNLLKLYGPHIIEGRYIMPIEMLINLGNANEYEVLLAGFASSILWKYQIYVILNKSYINDTHVSQNNYILCFYYMHVCFVHYLNWETNGDLHISIWYMWAYIRVEGAWVCRMACFWMRTYFSKGKCILMKISRLWIKALMKLSNLIVYFWITENFH